MGSAAVHPTPPMSPALPTSPTASLYDLSDDDEEDYNTIMHSSSGRGVKLLFSKSKVCNPAMNPPLITGTQVLSGLCAPYAFL